MSSFFINSAQNELVNTESRSDTILDGKPCSLQTFDKKSFAQPSAVFSFSLIGIKCAIFVKRSTTTHTVVQPSERGSWTMKSMDIESHGEKESSRGCKVPCLLCRD